MRRDFITPTDADPAPCGCACRPMPAPPVAGPAFYLPPPRAPSDADRAAHLLAEMDAEDAAQRANRSRKALSDRQAAGRALFAEGSVQRESATVFRVASASRNCDYFVSVDSQQRPTACTCKDWQTRRRQPGATACKHQVAVAKFLDATRARPQDPAPVGSAGRP